MMIGYIEESMTHAILLGVCGKLWSFQDVIVAVGLLGAMVISESLFCLFFGFCF